MSIDYAKLTVPQKWQWHAEVYALRRVLLDVSHDEHTSPSDPKGEWFDGRLVAVAEQRYRDKHAEQVRKCRASTEAANAIRFADAERWRNSPEGKEHLLGTRRRHEGIRHEDYGLRATEVANGKHA